MMRLRYAASGVRAGARSASSVESQPPGSLLGAQRLSITSHIASSVSCSAVTLTSVRLCRAMMVLSRLIVRHSVRGIWYGPVDSHVYLNGSAGIPWAVSQFCTLFLQARSSP